MIFVLAAFCSALLLLSAAKINRSHSRATIPAASSEYIISCAPPDIAVSAGPDGKFIPLLPGTGKHHFTISGLSDSAQQYFDQGLRYYYSYHLKESLASFKEAARFDSVSGMIYWGQALAMGPYFNLYSYKYKPAVAPALALMKSKEFSATGKEQALMAAMERRYSEDTTGADRAQLDSGYAAAMSGVMKAFPDDVKSLYIDAVMLTHKWDFWTTDAKPKPWTPELIGLCEDILKRDPDQPAALHYYIHITEASNNPERALPGAERLRLEMPGIGHMVHMSTHMYQRNGLFLKGVRGNEASMAALNREDSLAPMLHLGQNDVIHVFAVQAYCALNAGLYKEGMPMYYRARERVVAGKPVFVRELYAQMVYMLPELAWVRFGKWNEILADSIPNEKWTYASALYHFAHGIASVRSGQPETAEKDLKILRNTIGDSLMNVRARPWNAPATCAAVAAAILNGEILFAAGKKTAAVDSLNQACQLEDGLIYREPKEWMLPSRQYLGRMLLEMHEPVAAEQVYRQDLVKNPGNSWSLLGLANSQAMEGKKTSAEKTKAQSRKAFEGSDLQPRASVY